MPLERQAPSFAAVSGCPGEQCPPPVPDRVPACANPETAGRYAAPRGRAHASRGAGQHEAWSGCPPAVALDSAGQVRAALAGALAAGVTVLVADMTATAYCSLEGVHALLRARRAAEAAGAQLRLAAVRPAVRRALELTGTSGLLPVYRTLEAARDGRGR